jgi:hypothetical protein
MKSRKHFFIIKTLVPLGHLLVIMTFLTGCAGKAEAQMVVPDQEVTQGNTLYLHIGETVLTATLVDNSSTVALKRLLAQAPITIDMRDYGNMEKVGGLGTSLPRNDERITAGPGDLILYQGNAFVIYYAPNTYSFTRLGKINNVTAQELKNILGSGNVTVTLSLSKD